MNEATNNAEVSSRPARGERGFTIIELLIVMGISLFGLAGLMSVYSSASSANEGMGHSSEAIDVCEQTMENFRSFSVPNIEVIPAYGAITAAGWGPVAHHQGDVIGRNGVIFGRRVSAIEIPGNTSLVRLKVDVLWTDNGTDPALATAAEIHTIGLEMIRTRTGAL